MTSEQVKTRISVELEAAATQIVDGALQVHRALGAGLFEAAYQICLAHELRKRGLSVECELPLPAVYDGIKIGNGYRIDMLIEDQIVIENKTVEAIAPIHEAQLMTY